MPTPQPDLRPFNLPDAEALTFSSAMVKVFEVHAAAFVALDPMFGGTFVAEWKAAIAACYAHDTDELMRDRLIEKSEQVEAAVRQGMLAMSDLRYFASKAFAPNGLYKVFHFKEHDQMRQRSAWYPIYLHTQHSLALRYATELQAKGMTPAQMAALATAAEAVRTADLALQLQKRDRTEATVLRLALMAKLWSFVQKVNAAAQVVFVDDPVKRALFNVG